MARLGRRKPATVGSYILSMIIFLGIGGFFLVTGFTEYMDSKKIPVDFNTVSADELKLGMVLEGDLSFNLGKFMESYRTKYGVKTGSSTYYYIIPAGGEATPFLGPFMSLKGNTNINQDLDRQSGSLYNSLSGFDFIDVPTVHIKGKLKKLSSEDKGYLRDALKQIGYSSSEIESMISPYTFEYSNFNTYNFFFIAGGIFFLLGFLYAIPGIVRLKKQKSTALGEGFVSYGAEAVNTQQSQYGSDMNMQQNQYEGDMNAAQNPYGNDMNMQSGSDMGEQQNPYGQDDDGSNF